jgi:hypothetical protein
VPGEGLLVTSTCSSPPSQAASPVKRCFGLTTREQVERISLLLSLGVLDDDGMPSVVPAGASRTNVRFGREDIDELALALVTPLGAEAAVKSATVRLFTCVIWAVERDLHDGDSFRSCGGVSAKHPAIRDRARDREMDMAMTHRGSLLEGRCRDDRPVQSVMYRWNELFSAVDACSCFRLRTTLLPGPVRSSAPKSPEQGPVQSKTGRLTWISANCEFPILTSF